MVQFGLKHLRYVLAVTEHGSMTRAATALGIETSAISRRIREVEDELGVSLFLRGAGGATLTDAGHAFVDATGSTLQLLEAAADAARAAGEGKTGRLRIGFLWPFSCGPALELLRAYRTRFDQVIVETIETSQSNLIACLNRRDLDAILIAADKTQQSDLSSEEAFKTLPLWEETLSVALPSAALVGELKWSDLAGQKLIGFPADDCECFADYVANKCGVELSFVKQNCSREGLMALVSAGFGWQILPSSLASLSIEGIKTIPINEPTAKFTIVALSLSTADNPALTRFLSLARQMFGRGRPQFAADTRKPTRDRWP